MKNTLFDSKKIEYIDLGSIKEPLGVLKDLLEKRESYTIVYYGMAPYILVKYPNKFWRLIQNPYIFFSKIPLPYHKRIEPALLHLIEFNCFLRICVLFKPGLSHKETLPDNLNSLKNYLFTLLSDQPEMGQVKKLIKQILPSLRIISQVFNCLLYYNLIDKKLISSGLVDELLFDFQKLLDSKVEKIIYTADQKNINAIKDKISDKLNLIRKIISSNQYLDYEKHFAYMFNI